MVLSGNIAPEAPVFTYQPASGEITGLCGKLKTVRSLVTLFVRGVDEKGRISIFMMTVADAVRLG